MSMTFAITLAAFAALVTAKKQSLKPLISTSRTKLCYDSFGDVPAPADQATIGLFGEPPFCDRQELLVEAFGADAEIDCSETAAGVSVQATYTDGDVVTGLTCAFNIEYTVDCADAQGDGCGGADTSDNSDNSASTGDESSASSDKRKRQADNGVFDLPLCRNRDTETACNAGCDVSNLFETCDCLWDVPGDGMPADGGDGVAPCPDGLTCCFNLPCDRPYGPSDCIEAGGSETPSESNCEFFDDLMGNSGCRCRAPLVTIENPDLFAPYDCSCPFIDDAEWLMQGGVGECVVDGGGNAEPNESLPRAAVRRASLRLAGLLEDANFAEFEERCPTDTLRVTGKAARRICKRLEKLFKKFSVPARHKRIRKKIADKIEDFAEALGCDFVMPPSCARGASLLAESELTAEELASVEPFTIIDSQPTAAAAPFVLAFSTLFVATVALLF